MVLSTVYCTDVSELRVILELRPVHSSDLRALRVLMELSTVTAVKLADCGS